jgi:hypothetical protein
VPSGVIQLTRTLTPPRVTVNEEGNEGPPTGATNNTCAEPETEKDSEGGVDTDAAAAAAARVETTARAGAQKGNVLVCHVEFVGTERSSAQETDNEVEALGFIIFADVRVQDSPRALPATLTNTPGIALLSISTAPMTGHDAGSAIARAVRFVRRPY